MAGIDGMAFTASGLPLPANKENGTFCWQDMANEAGSTDFFDQYVELGDSDAESRGEGVGRLGQYYGASELTISPHPPAGHVPPADEVGPVAGIVPNPQGRLLPAGAIDAGSTASLTTYPTPSTAKFPRPRPEQNPLHRGISSMAGFSGQETKLEQPAPPIGLGEARSAGGSISDSELLRLEGLSMRSPRVQMHPSASVPATPPSQSPSPRKAGRLHEFCSKIRSKAAALPGKRQQPEAKAKSDSLSPLEIPIMSTAQMEPAITSGRSRPYSPNLSTATSLSPPNASASAMSAPSHQPLVGPSSSSNSNSKAGFVNGFLDDPFIPDSLPGTQFVQPFQAGSTLPQTPLQTPLLDSIPVWQMPLSAPNNKPLWAPVSSQYFVGANSATNNNWWEPPADVMDTDPPSIPLPLSYPAATNARNASLNLANALDNQQSFEYPAPPGTENGSFTSGGLMIHMPQPRAGPSPVLYNDSASQGLTRTDQHHRRPKPRAPSSGARHHHYNANGTGFSSRKARAASGSSRGFEPDSPSPTTPSQAPGAGTTGTTAIATSYPPTSPSIGRLHRRSASMQTLSQTGLPSEPPTAIRKRRSWTGRRTTTSSSATALRRNHSHSSLALPSLSTTAQIVAGSSSNTGRRRTTVTTSTSTPSTPNLNHHHTHPNNRRKSTTTITSSSSNIKNNNNRNASNAALENVAAAAVGASSDGFVNYTPQDRTLLMTGVAPSGSSKTKARREKEAVERQREFRDRLARMVQAVQAAGGDVSKLSGELVDGVDPMMMAMMPTEIDAAVGLGFPSSASSGVATGSTSASTGTGSATGTGTGTGGGSGMV